MKILILGFAKLKYMPYLNLYLKNIDKKHCIDVIYWNRDGEPEELSKYKDVSLYEFSEYQEDNVAPLKKVRNFIKYRKFTKNVLRNNSYEFVICLHTFPAVLLIDKLIRDYKGNYIFDYRDSTYEKFYFFKKIIAKLVNNSFVTFVSSDGFRELLPAEASCKVFTTHNIPLDDLKYYEKKKSDFNSLDKVKVSFWGFIREESLNMEIITKFSQDDRFELHYYGREQQIAINLINYVKKIGATNVYFHGEYSPEDRYDFVKKTDIIHNIYSSNNTMIAMGNKYYDSLVFKTPQVCMENSHMAMKAIDAGIGCACNPYDCDFTDKLYNYYINLDMDKYIEACNNALCSILKEHENIERIIKEI